MQNWGEGDRSRSLQCPNLCCSDGLFTSAIPFHSGHHALQAIKIGYIHQTSRAFIVNISKGVFWLGVANNSCKFYMGNLLCSGLWTPVFLLFMFIFFSSLKHYSGGKNKHVIYIVLCICFYIHCIIITQATCDLDEEILTRRC